MRQQRHVRMTRASEDDARGQVGILTRVVSSLESTVEKVEWMLEGDNATLFRRLEMSPTAGVRMVRC